MCVDGRLNSCGRSHGLERRPRVIILRGHGAVALLCFLLIIGFDYVADDWACGFAPVSSRLNEHGNHDFWATTRRVADKPGIVFELLSFSEAAAQVVVDDLCGA